MTTTEQAQNVAARLDESARYYRVNTSAGGPMAEQQQEAADAIRALVVERDEAKRELHEAFRHPDFDQLLAKTILRAQSAEANLAQREQALREIRDGDGELFVRKFARDALLVKVANEVIK